MKKFLIIILSIISIPTFAYSSNNKKILLRQDATVGGYLGWEPVAGLTVTSSGGYQWTFRIDDQWSATVNPNLSIFFYYNAKPVYSGANMSSGAYVGVRSDFKYDIGNGNNFYIGLSLGAGGQQIFGYGPIPFVDTSLYAGTILQDQYKIGGFLSYGKGLIGAEFTYLIKIK